MTTTFTPDIIHSYAKLQNFLVGPEADARVYQRLQETGRPETGSTSMCYAVFLLVSGIFLETIGFLKQGLALQLRAEAIRRSNAPWERFGNDCIARSINEYSEEAIDKLFPLGNIPPAKIADPNLRAHITKDVLDFEKTEGICLGESRWFIRTYLKTNAYFATKRQHLEALGKLFKNGAPIEAAVLQKLWSRDEFLQLKTSERITLKNLQPNEQPLSQEKVDELISTFKNLEVGAYEVGVPKHEMAYISAGQGEGYFFDPNHGTAFIHNDEGFRKLADHIASYQELRSKFVDAIAKSHKQYARELLVDIERAELAD